MAINQKTDLSHLYEFRVWNGDQSFLFPNRYAASKKVASWLAQGHDVGELKAERKINGQWRYDGDTFEQAHKHLDRNATKPSTRKPVNPVRQALKTLSGATRLANTANELTRDHMLAVYNSCQEFIAAYDDAAEYHFDTDF